MAAERLAAERLAADLRAAERLAADLRAAGIRVLRDQALAPHTTMRVGGPAWLLAFVHTVPHLVAAIGLARSGGLPFVVLGRGSNVIVADRGLRGLVILNRAEGHAVRGQTLSAESGLPMAKAATLAFRAGLSGLEFGLAIPGTVGGAIWANAGAHGSDVAAVLDSVTLLRADGSEATEPAASLGLAYRESRLKSGTVGAGGEIALSASFTLKPDEPVMIGRRLDEIRRWRREHQPLELPSAGSVFRNPPGDSAGRLVDACGLKSRRVGGAVVSEKHANFIVNDRQASAADVRELAEIARSAVRDRFGVELAYEVQFLGDWPHRYDQEER